MKIVNLKTLLQIMPVSMKLAPEAVSSKPSYRARSAKYLLNISLIAICFVFVSGCAGIPIPEKVNSQKELSRKTVVTDKKFLKTVPEYSFDNEQNLLIALKGVYIEEGYNELTIQKDVRKRRIVFGFLPGYGVAYYSNGDMSKCKWVCQSFSYDPFKAASSEMKKNPAPVLLIAPFYIPALIGAAGIITAFETPIAFITEAFKDWDDYQLYDTIQDDKLPRAVSGSFFGWGKAGYATIYDSTEKVYFTENRKYDEDIKYVKPAISGYEYNIPCEIRGKKAYITPTLWPIITDKEVLLHVDVSGYKSQPTVPALIIGKKFRESLCEAKYAGKFWYYGQMVDFTESAQVKTMAKSSAEIIGTNSSSYVNVTVYNTGDANLFRLVGKVESDIKAVDGELLIFGIIRPGEALSKKLDIPVAAASSIKIEFREANGNQPPSLSLSIGGGK